MNFLVKISVVVAMVAIGIMLYPNPPLTKNMLEWQKKGQYFKFKSHDIFYIVENGDTTNGETLLIFHGFPTSTYMYDWIKMMPGLKKQFQQIVLYDMLGFGFSDKPIYYEYSILEQADIGEALLQKLGIKEYHILAHDYGDTVALETLARFNLKESNRKVKSLCLTNGGIFPETNFPILIQKVLLVPYLGVLAARLSVFPLFKGNLCKTFGPNTQPTAADLDDFYSGYTYKDGYKVSHRLIHYITERSKYKERWVGALQTTKVPVHTIYGPADPINPIVFIGHYKQTVPNPSITVLDQHTGHYPQFEDPKSVLKYYIQFVKKLIK